MRNHSKLETSNIEDIIGLTPMQEGMLFHYLSKPESGQYFEQISFHLSGKINMHFVKEAWNNVAKANEMLRAVFRWEGLDNPVQIVLKDYKPVIREYDLVSCGTQGRIRSLADVMDEDMKEGIDICSAPVRITVSKLDENKYNMMISFHHIIFDGWSTGVLLGEFFREYYDLYYRRKSTHSRKTRFKEYVKWLREREKKSQQKFWSDYFQEFETKSVLPGDYNKTGTAHTIERCKKRLDVKLAEQINNYAAAGNLTTAALMYCAWGILLQKYNNTDDAVFGTTVSGRPPEIKGVENMVGLFINTIPMRVRNRSDDRAEDLLRKVRGELEEREEYSGTPLTDIKKYSGLKEAGELFNSIVVIDNYPLDKKINLEDTELKLDLYSIKEVTNYDLTLQVTDFNGIELDFNYNAGIFDARRIERLAGHFINILAEIAEKPGIKVSDIEIMGTEEKRRILCEFNDTKADYPSAKTIHALFEERVQRAPEKNAVAFENKKLTYRQLNEKSNQLARAIKECGVGAGTVIGLAVPRSLEMIIGIMAIFKANGICLPLDINHPKERNDVILENSEASIIIELEGHDFVNDFNGKRIIISPDIFERYSKENLQNQVKPSCLAYIIYTSGSTGKPKGAMLHHKGIINHIFTKAGVLGLTENDVIGNNFSVNVVASIWQMLSPLVLGGKLVIHSDEIERNPYEQFKSISADGITVIELIPPILNAYIDLLERGEERVNLPVLRGIALTSEPTKPILVNKFHRYYDIQLVNCYGQTECCDDTLHHAIPVCTNITLVPVGKPSLNTRAYILDRNNKLQPIGVEGELCISGDGVSAGYWNSPELTKEKFVSNPYEDENRLYRTGDLARWMEDGNIECLGRIDHQIKIRGNRIELGEIETKIYKYPGVKSVAVIAKEDFESNKYLCAYIVSKNKFTVGALRSFLSKELPEHSVPSSFVRLKNMPLTPNGKVDRKVLYTMGETVSIGTAYVAPKSQIEKKLLSIWRDILKKDKIGINDNFFDSGGHSLLLVKLQSGINRALNINLSPVEILRYPTIGSLSRYLSEDGECRKDETEDEGSVPNAQSNENNETGIAIIGMSGRFPRARNISEFWGNLKNGIEAVSFFEDSELEIEDAALLNNPDFVNSWGVLEDIEMFDASFFGFTPREAELMDPQHRIFMECAWEALESAGYSAEEYNGRIGVYAGAGMSTYLLTNIAPNRELVESAGKFQLAIGNDKDFIATRTAYKLNLKGPALTVQTACSTSLVAVHLACKGILNGECDMALSGGSYIKLPQKSGYVYETGGNTSPDGCCKTFDADARGSVMGNGAGVVVLKRLKDAVLDGDHIYAVIKGSAINNDGSLKAGYTAPSIDGQAEVIEAAQKKAGINAETVGYIETHGTGTELGDPVELAALTKVFSKNTRRKNFCAIGAVKPNIGHLDVAAGVAGLIKAALVIKNGMIPPNLYFELPNPQFDFINSPFYTSTSLEPWETNGVPRRAGISSFGIGGTNVHMVLEEGTHGERANTVPPSHHLLIISSKTRAALDRATEALGLHLKGNPDIDISSVAYTSQVGRSSFAYRRMLLCRDRNEAVNLLEHSGAPGVLTAESKTGTPLIAFILAGQSIRNLDMSFGLYMMQPVYRQNIDRCSKYLKDSRGFDLQRILYHQGKGSVSDRRDFQDESINKAAAFTLQFAMALLWVECGAKPQFISGKGVGKYAALCIAGILTPEDALEILLDSGGPGGLYGNNGHQVKIKTEPARIAYISSSTGHCAKPGQTVDLRLETGDALQTTEIINIIDRMAGDEGPVCILLENRYREDAVKKDKRISGASKNNLIGLTLDDNVNGSDWEILMKALGRLWLEGVYIKWVNLYSEKKYSRLPLPTYPFERKYYWIDKNEVEGKEEQTEFLLEKTPDVKQWFYFPVWRQSRAASLTNGLSLRRDHASWIIFLDNRGIGSAVSERLTSMGCEVISVLRGAGFTKSSENAFCINPKSEDDYKALIAEILSSGQALKYVVHLWSIDETPTGLDSRTLFKELQFAGFYSLLYLTKALIDNHVTHDVETWIVSSNVQNVTGNEQICSEKSTLLGICKVIRQEHTNIICRSVDILNEDIESDGNGRLGKKLLGELALKADDIDIAYRDGNRWVQDFEQVLIEDEYKREPRLKKKGTYIITGGFGEIGHVFAEHLSKTYQANLVLIGRTPLPDREHWDRLASCEDGSDPVNKRINRIKLYESYGSKVLYDCIDVADEEGMKRLVDRVYSEFIQVNGVIHLAGITGEEAVRTIKEESFQSCQAQFKPKIYGIYTLERLFKGKKLDFCLAVSSLCAILGGLGSTAYASANIFIDSFAQKKFKEGDFPLVSVNWEAWLSSGDKRKWLTLDKLAVSSEEGREIFDILSSLDITPRLVVSTADIHKRCEQWLGRYFLKGSARNKKSIVIRHKRPGLKANYTPPECHVEKVLCDVWQALLGIDRIGTGDNFFELGGHSLLATRIVSKIREIFRIEIPLRSMFDRPTVKGLSETVAELWGGAEAAEQIALLYEQVEGFSDKEVEELMLKLEI